MVRSLVRGLGVSGYALIAGLIISGCVRSRVTAFEAGSVADRRTPAERIRFYETLRPTCAYRELGHVTAHSSYFASWNKVVRTARERAHRMGGDAIVSVRERSQIDGAILSPQQVSLTETTVLSGTVIRFTNPACRQ